MSEIEEEWSDNEFYQELGSCITSITNINGDEDTDVLKSGLSLLPNLADCDELLTEKKQSTTATVTADIYQTDRTVQECESDDEIPLARLRQMISEKQQNSEVRDANEVNDYDYGECDSAHSSQCNNNSDEDKEYIPSSSTSDSGSDTEPITFDKRKRKWWRRRNRNLKRNCPKRTKQKIQKTSKLGDSCTQKERSKTMKSRIPTNTASNTNNENEQEETAERKSALAYKITSFQKKHHKRRLKNILTSNNLSIIETPADGDCFFNAVKIQLPGEYYTAYSLRLMVCEHLSQNKMHYIEFFKNSEHSEEENLQLYFEQIESLKVDEVWNKSVADAVPLAMANILKRRFIIYSSKLNNPVSHIAPSLEPYSGSSGALLFAYLAVPGFEHYDACIQSKLIPRAQTEYSEIQTQAVKPVPKDSSPHVTPRKKADYKSPEKKRRTRKRVAERERWKKNIRKQMILIGESYRSPTSNKNVQKKALKQHNCSKCRYHCSEKIAEDARQQIFDNYYDKDMSYERKRDFVCSHITVQPTNARNKKTYKQNARSYFLPSSGNLVRVCKSFFLSTLDISDKLVRCTLAKKQHGAFKATDQRGKHVPANRTSNARVALVKKHIESFPVVQSHYKRKGTNRRFLGADLSINKMYDLYKEKCKDGKIQPVSASVYRNIFCCEYNLSFHRPKKDTCDFCNAFQQKKQAGCVSENENLGYEEHIKRKERARMEKENDKERSKSNQSIYVATFDLQAVLYTPCSNVSKVYYKRKLNCYNLTVFSLADKFGTCYVWDETNGRRGSSEIGSCLITHIKSLPSTVKQVVLYSDCCSGQNRNQYLAAGLLHAVSYCANIESIEQKFLESGHTQMECDSMHAAIEHAKKGTSIYHPDQWDTVIHLARRNKPYVVVPMQYDQMYDLKLFAKQEFKGFKNDTEGNKVNWLKIKVLKVSKLFPCEIFVKHSFDEAFRVIKVNTNTRGRPSCGLKALPQKYDTKLPISEAKKKDLISLCNSLIIPSLYRPFYDAINASKAVKDHLPEPDVVEENEDNDE